MAGGRGFALTDVIWSLVMLGIAGSAALRGAMTVTRSVAEGGRWSALAAVAGDVLARLERDYRRAAPACTSPPGGVQGGPGVAVSWTVTTLGPAIEIELELRSAVGSRALVDTVVTRVHCR
jgi:hypothetical protein